MRKHIQIVLIISVVISITTGFSVKPKETIMTDPTSIYLDGIHLNSKQPAIKVEGVTMVPMRSIFEYLGARVIYNAKTETISATRGTLEIMLKVGSQTAFINGRGYTLEQAPVITNGYTMVPLRFVSNALGAKVTFSSDRYFIYSFKDKSSFGANRADFYNGKLTYQLYMTWDKQNRVTGYYLFYVNEQGFVERYSFDSKGVKSEELK